jgi:tripartite-type tricarboxylate transporter receptor subunit TctC
MTRFIAIALSAGVFAGSCVAQGQSWPAKPVSMINPFAPGGGVDAFGRPLSAYLSKTLGQQFLVENLPGAGGTVGAAAAAKRPGDGYNFFLGAVHHTIAESLYARLPYSLERDFVPITVLAYVPNVVVVHPKHRNINNLRDLIAYGKANPGKLNFGSAGNGTTHHLAGELFKIMTGVDITHIPYKGAGPMMVDLLAGQVDMAFDGMATSAPQIKAGKLKALAVTSGHRSPLLPEVPTMKEAGVPDFVVAVWLGFAVPAGTPANVVQRFNAEINRISQDPKVRDKLLVQGFEMLPPITPEATRKTIEDDQAFWLPLIKQSGATAE